jgi:magnesium chelatase subunit D
MSDPMSEPTPNVKKKPQQRVEEDSEAEELPDVEPTEPARQNVFNHQDERWWEGGKQVEIGSQFQVARRKETSLDRLTRRQSGRRTQTRTDRKRGRYIQARPANGKVTDIAFDATIRAAAPYQLERDRGGLAFALRRQDLQRKVRVTKQSNLILFVVDASWSMAVAERMQATKGAIMSLLTDAYQQRDRVGLVVFQKNRAIEILPPTNSVELAQKALADIPVGGKTPLSAGLTLAHQIIERERLSNPDVMPMLIILTDGAGNVSMTNMPPQEEAHFIAEQIQHDNVKSVVINMEHVSFDQGLAQKLADHLGGPCYTLAELRADLLYQTVRSEMAG